MSQIKAGCIARCSRGLLGLVTSGEKVLTRYGERAWTGIQLSAELLGNEWCSRDPTFVAESVEALLQESKLLQVARDEVSELSDAIQAVDVIAVYTGNGKDRQWWSGGTWLYPDFEVVLREVPQEKSNE